MIINNPPQQVPFVQDVYGVKYYLYCQAIGDWNMNADSHLNLALPITVSWTNIRDVSVIIRNDADNGRYPINSFSDNADPLLLNGGISNLSIGFIGLTRRTGGLYNTANFDSVGYNRGWVFYWVAV